MHDPQTRVPVRRAALCLGSVGLLIPFLALVGRAIYDRLSIAGFLAVGLGALLVAGLLLAVDVQHRRREKREAVAGLVEQLRSPHRHARLLALEELRARGWLKDGSLHGVDLCGVDLQGVNLGGADLKRARLKGANLRGAALHWTDLSDADLSGVSLTGANLLWANLRDARGVTDCQLSGAYILRRATLPDGSPYDGRYNLRGDLDDARLDRVRSDDAGGLARWYDVPLEAYRRGQTWARENLSKPENRESAS
jgi:hypothetical protein